MNLYKQMGINDLNQLQQQVLNIIDTSDWETWNLSYKWSDQLFQNNILIKNLRQYNWHNKVKSIGIFALTPDSDFPIHHDSTGDKYSLNIPIQNCNNTYTLFYESEIPPSEQYRYDPVKNHRQSYWQYDSSRCKEIARIEMSRPHLIDVSGPHNVINPTNKTRIIMLVRLSTDIEIPQ